MKINEYEESIRIGFIQTRLNIKSAYYRTSDNLHPPMSKLEEYEATREIREGFRQLERCEDRPHIIIAPELASPRKTINEIEKHACLLQSIVIIGTDYKIDYTKRECRNEILVIIPDRWPYKNYNKKTFRITIGKSNYPHLEENDLKERFLKHIKDERLWIFDTGKYGSFGVVNCYDFMDVELHYIYRGKIQHLFVLSYNKDVNSFIHIAEALCRTLYCNVIICNTGFYGGTVCVSPYKDHHKRTIYKQEGSNIFASHVIQLPLREIIRNQNGLIPFNSEFKSLPAGW